MGKVSEKSVDQKAAICLAIVPILTIIVFSSGKRSDPVDDRPLFSVSFGRENCTTSVEMFSVKREILSFRSCVAIRGSLRLQVMICMRFQGRCFERLQFIQ